MRNGKPALASDFGVKPPSATADQRKWHFLAIDPGDAHVGLAEFERKSDGIWYCVWAGEKTPGEFLPWYVEGIRHGRWERIVVESWKLFPQAAPVYVGSDMPTPRLIGAIKALAAFCSPEGAWFDEAPKVVFQDPQIKVPTRGVLKRRKLRSMAKVLRVPLDHASDAELHGFKYLIDTKQTFENTTQQERRLRDVRPDLSHSHYLW